MGGPPNPRAMRGVEMKRFLCRIGIHKWQWALHVMSRFVISCARCGKTREVTPHDVANLK